MMWSACEGLCDISSSGWSGADNAGCRVQLNGADGSGWTRAQTFRKTRLVREPHGAGVRRTIGVSVLAL